MATTMSEAVCEGCDKPIPRGKDEVCEICDKRLCSNCYWERHTEWCEKDAEMRGVAARSEP